MKKTKLLGLLFVVLILLAAAPLSAFEKGTKGFGGSFYFGGEKYNRYNDAIYSLAIKPRGSYFILDNLCLDLDLSLGLYMSKDEPIFPSFGIGFGGRYFVKRFYGGVSFFFETHKVSHYEIILDDDGLLFDTVLDGTKWRRKKKMYFKLGYLFPIVKNIFLDVGAFYRIPLGNVTDSRGASYKLDLKTFGTNVGLAVYL